MKHMLKKIAVLFLMSVCLTSCFNLDSPLYSGVEVCKVISGTKLLTDEGNTLNIIQNQTLPISDTLKRVIISCDVLDYTEGKEDEFDIRLLSFAPMDIKEIIPSSSADEEALGDDGIDLDSAWLGGGYLNAFVGITKEVNSKKNHSVNLVLDELHSSPDTLHFKFRHNAYGDSFDNPDIDSDNITTEGFYYSFPIEYYIPSGVQSVVLHLQNDWFTYYAGIIKRDKETYDYYLKYTR